MIKKVKTENRTAHDERGHSDITTSLTDSSDSGNLSATAGEKKSIPRSTVPQTMSAGSEQNIPVLNNEDFEDF